MRLFELSLGAGFGLGLTSLVYFVLAAAGAALPAVVVGFDVLLLSGTAVFAWRAHRVEAVKSPLGTIGWIAAVALTVASLLHVAAFVAAVTANPHGDWDAWAMWTLRAKYLAAPGDAWKNAVSPLLVETQPGYPLLLPGAIARLWNYGSAMTPAAPIAVAGLFAGSIAGLLVSGLALLRSPLIGLLAGGALLSTAGFTVRAASLYADLPLAFWMLAACILLATGRREGYAAGGFAASLAAWTKDEGILFAAAVVVTMSILLRRRRLRDLAWLMAGAAPAGFVVLVFKLGLAPPSPWTGAFSLSRVPAIAGAFAGQVLALGSGLAHPVLLLAIVSIGLGLAIAAEHRNALVLTFGTVVLMLCGYTVAIAKSPGDVNWQIGTAVERLLFQVWPLIVFGWMLAVRTPAVMPHPLSAAVTPVPRARGSRRKRS